MISSNPEIATSTIHTEYGQFSLFVFSWSSNEQDNALVLKSKTLPDQPVVRIQSACYTGEIFRSLDCDCHWQLDTSLKLVEELGGLFVYMLKDGRGAGLLTKVRGLALSETKGLDTADAYRSLGIPLDPRTYEQPAFILHHFRVSKLTLLTNNPRKILAMKHFGFQVTRRSLESAPTNSNESYLKTKAQKLGHLLSAFRQSDDRT